MTHPRQLIRKAVVQTLTGKTSALDHVQATRLDRYKRNELPALSVSTPSEEVDIDSLTSTGQITRELKVEIVGTVMHGQVPLDDAMDNLASEVEAVMADDPELGDTAESSVLESSEFHLVERDNDPLVGVVVLTYSVTYRSKPLPATVPNDFLAAGLTTQFADFGADNALRDQVSIRSTGGSSGGGSPPGGGVLVRDDKNGNYYPASREEWSALLASAGLAGGPSSVWSLQEPSGPALDAIGGITLTPANWTLWRQPVPGAARVAMRAVDAVTNCKLMNSTTAPNPALTSTLLLMYLDIPPAPPSTRFVAVAGGGCDLRYNSAGKLVLQTSAVTPFPTALVPGPRWVILQCDITAKTTKAFTAQEKVVGTFVLPSNAPFIALGSNNGPAGAIGYAYAAQFTGAAAERPEAQVKRLLQALGDTVLW